MTEEKYCLETITEEIRGLQGHTSDHHRSYATS